MKLGSDHFIGFHRRTKHQGSRCGHVVLKFRRVLCRKDQANAADEGQHCLLINVLRLLLRLFCDSNMLQLVCTVCGAGSRAAGHWDMNFVQQEVSGLIKVLGALCFVHLPFSLTKSILKPLELGLPDLHPLRSRTPASLPLSPCFLPLL